MKDAMADPLREILNAAIYAVGKGTTADGNANGIIYLRDFVGGVGSVQLGTQTYLATGATVPLMLAVGKLSQLPAGHWLLDAIPASDCYPVNGLTQWPGIVLGLPQRIGQFGEVQQWRDWYFLREAKVWTANAVRSVALAKAKEAEREKEELEAARRRAANSEAARLRLQLKELKHLEELGLLGDDVPPPAPTVRIGR